MLGSAGEEEVPSQQVGLDAYIKPDKRRGKRKGNATSGGSGREDGIGEQAGYVGTVGGANTLPQSARQEGTVRCPVCDDFEGDEAAVAHHVAGHFDA